MTVDECLQAYETLAGRVFGHPRLLHIRNSLWPKDKYDDKVLESVIEEIVRQREGSTRAAFPQRNEDMCRTYVMLPNSVHTSQYMPTIDLTELQVGPSLAEASLPARASHLRPPFVPPS